MKKYFLREANMILFATVLMSACSSNQKAQKESPVGIITYNQYATKAPSATDTSYYAISNQEAFDAVFTTSTVDQLPKPGFSGQTVVAIAMPGNGAAKIERATINGKIMSVYASSCIREAADCPKNGLSLITTPKSSSVRNVQFFMNGANIKTIEVQ